MLDQAVNSSNVDRFMTRVIKESVIITEVTSYVNLSTFAHDIGIIRKMDDAPSDIFNGLPVLVARLKLLFTDAGHFFSFLRQFWGRLQPFVIPLLGRHTAKG